MRYVWLVGAPVEGPKRPHTPGLSPPQATCNGLSGWIFLESRGPGSQSGSQLGRILLGWLVCVCGGWRRGVKLWAKGGVERCEGTGSREVGVRAGEVKVGAKGT